MDEDLAESLSNLADELERASENARCIKLDLPDYIAAFLNRRELHRNCEQILCDQSLLEDVAANYVIVKKILSSLPWQDKLICKNVCSMWRAAVNTLQKEEIGPSDFAVSMKISHIRNGIMLLKSDSFYTEPLAVFAFTNSSGFSVACKCDALKSCPCDPPCGNDHYLLDVVQNQVVIPKTCMLAVKASHISYMPLPLSLTNQVSPSQKFGSHTPFLGGIYIPVIPNVDYQVINIKLLGDIQKNFFKTIDNLSKTRYVKGALVFVNGSFILQSVDDIVFLNYLATVQPNVPYALGGCLVDDTVSDIEDMTTMIDGTNTEKDVVTENLVSIGLFTVPKNLVDTQTETGCNFDMFSLVLESSDWSKAKMQSAINEFSRKVPHFEHSVVIKLSCVGRDSRSRYEQDFFRAAFPTTRLLGCYGNGELGLNLPPRMQPESLASTVKRHRADPGAAYGILHSYATVFVYIGWGKIITPAEST